MKDYKKVLMGIGILFIFLSLSLFAKGLVPSMAEFKVPTEVLNSPHYYDAILWVYVHMTVLGILIFLLGYSVSDPKKQQVITLLLFFITCLYTYLDFHSSDSVLGNGLYQGESSVIPAFISLLVNVVLLQLWIRNRGNIIKAP